MGGVRRKLVLLLVAIALCHAFLALRFASAVLHTLSLEQGFAVFDPSPALRGLIKAAWVLLYKSAGFA
jgi:hypothetical protein